MSGSILSLGHAPARLVLAGRPRRVGQLTVGDLARLQRYVADRTPVVMPRRPEGIDDDPEAVRRHHVRCWRAVRSWPPELGTPAAERVLSTVAGAGYQLRLATRRWNKGLGLPACRALAVAMTAAEWDAADAVMWAIDPAAEHLAQFDPPKSGGDAVPWRRAIVEVCHKLNQPAEVVFRMPLGEFHAHRDGGLDPGLVVPPGVTKRQAAAERRRLIAEAVEEGERLGVYGGAGMDGGEVQPDRERPPDAPDGGGGPGGGPGGATPGPG